MSYGAQVILALARQTAAGSAGAVVAAGSYHHIPYIREDIGLEKQEVVSQNLTGSFDQGASYDGVANVAGTIEVEPLPKALGMLLTGLIGVPTSVTSGSLRTLSYLPRTLDFNSQLVNDPVSAYVKFSDVASADMYYDLQVSQGEFQFSQGQLLRTRVTVAGGLRMPTGVGSLGIVLDTVDLAGGWLWDTASISVGGTAVAQISDITVAINENISPLYTMNGTLLPYKYTRSAFREVTVQGNMIFDSRSLFNDFVVGTQRQLLITARNTRMQVQSGYYPTLTLDVPQMKITAMKPAITGPSEVTLPFTARGVKDPSSGYTLKMTLSTTYAAGY